MNGNRVLGIVFANIHEEALDSLTAMRTMGSVPFCSPLVSRRPRPCRFGAASFRSCPLALRSGGCILFVQQAVDLIQVKQVAVGELIAHQLAVGGRFLPPLRL